ncbi:MAG: hypothetical protein ACRDOL_34095, partial [Streptosporangiaceae bacterium]
ELKGGMGRSLTPEPGSVPAVGERVSYAASSPAYQPPAAFPDPRKPPGPTAARRPLTSRRTTTPPRTGHDPAAPAPRLG